MSEPCLIVRLSETTLKGGNRARFERQLAENAAAHLAPHGEFRLKRETARLIVTGGDGGSNGGLRIAEAVLRCLPGVANLSLARPVPAELEPLTTSAMACLDEWLARPEWAGERRIDFKVEVHRTHKGYPLNSMQIASHLGAAALARHPRCRVNLDHPELMLQVEIQETRALLFDRKVPGPGGLAVGTGGKTVCLLSGGIDSPVAAYLMMTRGVRVVYLNFHSYPFIGEQSKEKVHDLVRHLARYQPASRLYVAPFATAQAAIRDHCPEALRTLLYRRMMNRVANRVIEREGAEALVTGESVGQVASQTLPNIRAIADTAEWPVLQPLIGLSKPEIVHRARAIGTYPISIQPFPDCCTLFQPRRPETRAKIEVLEKAEAHLPVCDLVAESLEGLEKTDYGPIYSASVWNG